VGICAGAWRGGRALALAVVAVLGLASAAHAQAGAGQAPPDAAAAAAAAAAADAPPAHTATIVLPVATTPGYESLGAGLRAWMAERLAVAGLDVTPLARVDGVLKSIGQPVRHGSEAPVLALKLAAATVLFGELWVDGAEVELRLHAHSAADGQLLVGSRERGALADLPKMAERLLVQTAGGMGFDAGSIAGAAPRLSDWAALARARARLEQKDLAGAWRELVPASGPTAEKLRAEIDATQAPPATRSRLANVSNRNDQNWLRVRDALRDPREAETVLAGGDAATARGEPDRALRFYEKAAELAPTNLDAQYGRADSLLELGRGQDAAAAFLRAAELARGDARPYLGLARIDTLPAAERAAHLLRAGELQTARFELEAARESLGGVARLDPGLAAAAATRLGALEELLGDVDAALDRYREARDSGAMDSATLLGFGRMSVANGDANAGAEAFREALKQQPELEPALAGLGEALAAVGQDDAAQEALTHALTRAPQDFAARRALGRVLARGGNAPLALETLEAKGGAAHERSLLLLEAAMLRRDGGDLPAAERILDEAVELAPEDPDVRNARAAIYSAAGQADRATAEREIALLLGATDAPPPTKVVAKTEKAPEPAPEPARAAEPAPSPRKAAVSSSFATLVASFPTANPGSGRPLGRVVLLGTRDGLTGAARIRRWLHPRKPDLAAIDLALLEAIAARFPVEETPDLATAAPAVLALVAGSQANDLIAAANESLGTDAVFVARVESAAPDAMFWTTEQPRIDVRLLGGATGPGVFVVSETVNLDAGAGFAQWNYVAFGPWLAIVALAGFAMTRRRGAPKAAAPRADRAPAPAPPPREAPVQAPRRESAPAQRTRAPVEAAVEPEPVLSEADDEGPAAIAQRFKEAGQFPAAAAAFEAAFDYDSAIECYRSAGDTGRVLELLEKTGRDFEAGQVALERGENDRAIRNLQNVDLRDPDYDEACRVLADLVGDADDASLDEEKDPTDTTDADSLDTTDAADAADLPLARTEAPRGAPESFEDDSAMSLERSDQTLNADLPPHLDPNVPTPSPGDTSDAIAGIKLERVERAPDPPPAESRYELLNEIGRGGMGVVYQARDRRLGRTIALKKLPEELSNNPTAVKLFLREARAAAALNHPNIVTLFDADQEAGGYYITMEFLDGLPLDQILQKRGRVSPGDAIRLGTQIATGLQYAHEQGVIHRDVKTSNLFFTRDRLVKIMDFGLAKMAQEVRRSAVIGGTPYYMAPEQATGDDADQRADLYAFGVTLFELLTGTLPFKDGDITWHHQNTPPPDPRTIAPDLPDAFAELVLQLLEKDPGARPPTAAEVGERLNEIAQTIDAG
jgi:tetratricopeptide (TPR) repeat protein